MALKMNRKLKAEWWELWWVKPGAKPEFIRMYGSATNPWIPDGCYPTKELALEDKAKFKNKYHKIFHIKRFTRNK